MKKTEEIIKIHSEWVNFLEYKLEGGHLSRTEEDALKDYVLNKKYITDADDFLKGSPFPIPFLKTINKMKTTKKRKVFVFPENKNMFLKFIAYRLMALDEIFSPCLCSFRKNICVKTAVRRITRIPGIENKYSYKTDISDYFNSADPEKLLPQLENILESDKKLFNFLKEILLNPFAITECGISEAKKGIMAGVPFSSFLANLFLSDLDRIFSDMGVLYFRYSDDIIIFSDTEEELKKYKRIIEQFLSEKGLEINRKKESHTKPGEEWEFLGFSYRNGTIDISETAIRKMKGKMKRKATALVRWKEKKNAAPERAAAAFIRTFNKKFFSENDGITWTRWYFPVINTDKRLHELDTYMQDCIRYIYAGNYSKKRFNLRYEDIKKLGYINLVNKYYEKI